jgi:hypothetical protein
LEDLHGLVSDVGVEPENCVALGAGSAFAVPAEIKPAGRAATGGVTCEGFALGAGSPWEASAADEGPDGGDDEGDGEDDGDEDDAEDRGDEDEPGGEEPKEADEAPTPPALFDLDGSELGLFHRRNGRRAFGVSIHRRGAEDAEKDTAIKTRTSRRGTEKDEER